MSMRVCVVGAGPAGLCAAKHSRQHGLEVTVFEQSGDVGGTWRYTECVGRDEQGAPVHTSMYRDLRINVPKDVVMFPGIPHKETEESYLTSNEILEYLNNYANMFDLRKLCKFHQHVTKISRLDNEWKVTSLDLISSTEHTYTFDALFICNGLNNKPYTPEIEGASVFEGHSMHSHDYRTPEPFSGQRVLILGGGASALDLSNHISRHADKVFFSHHSMKIDMENLNLQDNVTHKTDIKRLLPNAVEFKDGTVEEIDSLVYCTGFKCNYSFLDESCGITEDEGLVYPLYKHFVNANNDTMCILGNMCHSMQFPTFDIQVRFFTKSLLNKFLPAKEDMLNEIREYSKCKLVDGAPKKAYFNTTAEEDEEYYRQLATMADIEPLPKVLSKIFARAVAEIYANFPRFRGDKYTVLDNETFSVSAIL